MKRVLFALLGIAIGAGGAYFLVNQDPKVDPRFEPLPGDREVPFASSRGQTESPGGKYEVHGAVPGLSLGGSCAPEIMVVVHGFNNREDKAQNRFGVAKQSLEKNGYRGVVVGFSWDADMQHDPYSMTGYHAAKANTEKSGPLLAKFLDDLSKACPLAKVRVIGYSMGARLALEALMHLSGRVETVYLVGAALDNEEVQLDRRYGKAIAAHAGKVLNLFSPEDGKLGLFFWVKEGDRALGKSDVEEPSKAPRNYRSQNVARELPQVDDAGKLVMGGEVGKNHSGYLGTRDNEGNLTDDGAMNVVASDVAASMDNFARPAEPKRP